MESAQGFARTVMVTGGAGFIGSNFVRLMLAERPDVRVVNVDALTYAGCVDNLADVQDDSRYVFVRADVRDRAAMAQAFARYAPDAAVHFAAESHVDRSIESPLLFHDVNAGGTVALLEAARDAWACGDGFREGCLFVHVSTDEVYGDLPFDSRGDDAFREDAPLRPRSPYAASKAAAEMFVRAYGSTYGCLPRWCAARTTTARASTRKAYPQDDRVRMRGIARAAVRKRAERARLAVCGRLLPWRAGGAREGSARTGVQSGRRLRAAERASDRSGAFGAKRGRA